jgi:uncharacterized protein YoxC
MDEHDEKKVKISRHEDFDLFFNKVAWAAITAVVSFAAFQLNKLSDNVAELNKNMTIVVYQLQSVEKQSSELQNKVEDLTDRVNALEKKR